MDTIKKIFPLSFKGKTNRDLIISILLYILVDVLAGVVISLTSAIPVLGAIVGIVLGLAGLYALVGIILAILYRVEVIQ